MRERSIEKSVCRWAKLNDIWAWKLTVVGVMGVPDRLFIFPTGKIVFIEFKATGKALRPLQKIMHNMLTKRNLPVYTMDNKDDAIAVLTTHI